MAGLTVPLSDCAAVLLSDGTWHNTPAGLVMAMSPSFADATQADPVTGAPLLITPGDNWVLFTDDTGATFAGPFRAVSWLRLPGPPPV